MSVHTFPAFRGISQPIEFCEQWQRSNGKPLMRCVLFSALYLCNFNFIVYFILSCFILFHLRLFYAYCLLALILIVNVLSFLYLQIFLNRENDHRKILKSLNIDPDLPLWVRSIRTYIDVENTHSNRNKSCITLIFALCLAFWITRFSSFFSRFCLI